MTPLTAVPDNYSPYGEVGTVLVDFFTSLLVEDKLLWICFEAFQACVAFCIDMICGDSDLKDSSGKRSSSMYGDGSVPLSNIITLFLARVKAT